MTGWCLTKNKLQQLSKINFQCLRLFLSFSLLLGITTSFFIFPQITLAQEGWKTLFQNNFETGIANEWYFTDAGGLPLSTPWPIEKDYNNSVLSGSGQSWAGLRVGQNWTDYRFSLRVELIREAVHLNVRLNNTGRYFIFFHGGGLLLSKQFFPDTFFSGLARADFPAEMGTWHTVSITVQNNRIQVAVDGVDRIDYIDSNSLCRRYPKLT